MAADRSITDNFFLTRWTLRALDAAGVAPIALTWFGGLSYIGIGFLFGMGYYKTAIGIGAVVSWFDVLDGALARYQNRVSAFGGFLDSVLDRYAEGAVYSGIAYWFLVHCSWTYTVGIRELLDSPRLFFSDEVTLLFGAQTWAILTLAAFISAYQVSYMRARSENVIEDCSLGLFTRAWRILSIGAFGIFGRLDIAVALILIFSQFTIIQRVFHTRRELIVHGGPIKRGWM